MTIEISRLNRTIADVEWLLEAHARVHGEIVRMSVTADMVTLVFRKVAA